ncbi:hypothetical protein GQ55_6G282600 [Panicum hallii var. hallii]|uniref:KIB1-4 beta-propeller domain-containing protein n=1 Tax=Panicum hallii var. hallii TaxID=1504633 RepID=A0A2T7DAG2_9POAL|nr:hypothetical protein GQ55_6G282600 [Panicum hallii var. hallii]
MALSNRRRSCSPPATASSPQFPPELIPEVARRLTYRAYRALLPLTSFNLASQDESNALFHPTLRQIHRFRLHRMHLPLTGRDWAVTEFHPLGCRCRLAIYEIRGKVGQPSRCSLSIVSLLTGERTCLSGLPERISRVLLYGDLVLTWKYMERAIQYCRLEAADPTSYRLAAVELSEDKNSVELVLLGGNFDMHGEFPPRLHLAECCGELILIRTMDLDPRVYHFFRCKFGEAKWERITSLGGCTLFLTDGRFVGCLGPDHKGIRGDSMYITEYSDGNWYEYSLIDGSFNRFVAEYPGRAVPLVICPLFWVLPSMS